MTLFSNVIEQHLEDAVIMRELRTMAVRAPHYKLDDLVELDERLDAHLDGACVGGPQTRELANDLYSLKEPAEVFVLAYIAASFSDRAWLHEVLTAGCATEAAMSAVASALAWLPRGMPDDVVGYLAAHEIDEFRYFAFTAQILNRRATDEAIARALADKFAFLQARALRAIGELGLYHRLDVIKSKQESEHLHTKFWACWAGALLGDEHSARLLQDFIVNHEYAEAALNVLLRTLPPGQATQLLEDAADEGLDSVLVLRGAGIIGDPAFVPGLIEAMHDEATAKSAGEAFSMITGVGLAAYGLVILKEPSADDDDAPSHILSPDDALARPDPDRVALWWDANKSAFSSGNRFLVGRTVNFDQCARVLRSGFQRQRLAAAFDLAILKRSGLFETRAPGWRQLRLFNE